MSSEGACAPRKPDERLGWSRLAQDAGEAESPPEERESDLKVPTCPVGWFLLVLLAGVVLWMALLALVMRWTGHGPLG